MLEGSSLLAKEPWPPNYVAEFARRQQLIQKLRSSQKYADAANAYYADRCSAFISDFGITYDPRNVGTDTPTTMPFVMFRRQFDMVDFILACIAAQADGLEEKSRDMGATWIAVWISIWLWRYKDGSAVGWGSRKQELVDRIGDAGSIFEKIRMGLRYLPRELLPPGFTMRDHATFMKVLNPATGSSITGEVGDNIGRGGRTTVYFKDESAHYEHPELVQAALDDNTNVQIDISSVHGLGTVFHHKREAGIEWAPGQPAIRGKTNVFIADWRDHPAKTQEWYDLRKAKARDEGLLHKFAQEVDRDYAASLEGVIIPGEWIDAAVDAHLKLDYLGDWSAGLWGAGLDVADEGLDRNALAIRKGPILRYVKEWGDRDTGQTTRHCINELRPYTPLVLQYDCIGIGAGVKAEANRLQDPEQENEVQWPKGLELMAWNAGAAVQHPEEYVVEPKTNDPEELKSAPKNKDFYANLKAQGWWELRRRFEKTYRAVVEGEYYNVDELISLDGNMPLLRTVQKELAQPTFGMSARLKMLVNKKPEGAKSPNTGDAVMMAYWPIILPSFGEAVVGKYGIGASQGKVVNG